MTPAIEAVRAWLSTGALFSILFVLLRYGRPLIDFWIEKRKLDLQEKTQSSSDRRAEEESRHSMTISLLEAARKEAASLETKISQLDFDQGYVLHMDEALRHIEALINADTDVDLKSAVRMARAFLNRMRRIQDAHGTERNETQRAASAVALIEHKDTGKGPS